MSTVLTLSRVTLAGAQRPRLKDLSLEVQTGEVLGIAGGNGAGKSSLLRLGCAELRPNAGEIRLGKTPLTQLPPRERARRVAYLPQASTLQFDFTVAEVVQLGLAPHGLGEREKRAAVDWALEICDLLPLASRHYPTLSGGEQQRTHLARGLVQLSPTGEDGDLRGQVLLLDEPTSAMDLPHQERCLGLVRQLCERGCTILLVVHDINLLARSADRLLLLREGQVQAVGPVRDLLDTQQLSRLYDHPMHLLELGGDRLPLVQPAAHGGD